MPALSPFQLPDLLGHQLLWRYNTVYAPLTENFDPFDGPGKASF